MFNTRNVRWVRDNLGWYWFGELFKDTNKIGIIGNYYDVEERLSTLPELDGQTSEESADDALSILGAGA